MKLHHLVTSLLAISVLVAPAAAQTATRAQDSGRGWIAVVFAIVLVIAVGVGSFMGSKRTHQD